MRIILVAAMLVSSVAMPAMADDSDYVDNRSTGATVIESFYNAINRSEYARAYSYFGAEPEQSFEDFRDGYADTVSVTLRTARLPVRLQTTFKRDRCPWRPAWPAS